MNRTDGSTLADRAITGVEPDEPVFIFKASSPAAAELLTCYEMLLKDVPGSTSADRKEVRRWQRDVVKWQKEHSA